MGPYEALYLTVSKLVLSPDTPPLKSDSTVLDAKMDKPNKSIQEQNDGSTQYYLGEQV